MSRSPTSHRVVIGTPVGVRSGPVLVRAVIEEDRGVIRGHHLVVVRLIREEGGEQYVEMPLDELEPAPA